MSSPDCEGEGGYVTRSLGKSVSAVGQRAVRAETAMGRVCKAFDTANVCPPYLWAMHVRQERAREGTYVVLRPERHGCLLISSLPASPQ